MGMASAESEPRSGCHRHRPGHPPAARGGCARGNTCASEGQGRHRTRMRSVNHSIPHGARETQPENRGEMEPHHTACPLFSCTSTYLIVASARMLLATRQPPARRASTESGWCAVSKPCSGRGGHKTALTAGRSDDSRNPMQRWPAPPPLALSNPTHPPAAPLPPGVLTPRPS